MTKQEQDELNIIDKRDPLKFVGEITEEHPHREIVQPTAEDLYQPEYSRIRKFTCKYANCGRSFNEKQVLISHEVRCSDCILSCIYFDSKFHLPETTPRTQAISMQV